MRSILIASALATPSTCMPSTSAGLDPSAVVTGIYTLTATTQADTCDPQRFVGSMTVPIFADDTSIEITDVSSSLTSPTIARYSLLSSAGYGAQLPPAAASFAPCASGGAFSLDFTLTDASATAFDVDDEESWTIVAPGCPNTTIDAATVPSASCTTSRTLHYALVQACAAPCTIIETNLVPSCTCPQGSDSGG